MLESLAKQRFNTVLCNYYMSKQPGINEQPPPTIYGNNEVIMNQLIECIITRRVYVVSSLGCLICLATGSYSMSPTTHTMKDLFQV